MMKLLTTKFKTLSLPLRISLIIAISLLSLLVLVMLFISPTAEYVIEHNSKEWIGRKVEMEDLSINLMTGSVEIEDLHLFEKESDTVFVSIGRFYTNLTVYKALFGKYEITTLHIENPVVRLVQNGSHFNYVDLVESGDTTAVEDTTESEPVAYWVKNIALKNMRVEYYDSQLNAHFTITPLNLNCKDIAWNDPQHHYHLDLAFISGGRMNMDMDLQVETLDYQLAYLIEQWNLAMLKPYFTPYVKINDFGAMLSANFNIHGNFNHPESLAAKAMLKVDSVRLTDDQNRLVMAMQQLDIQLDTLNTNNNVYALHHVNMIAPFMLVEMYPKGTNFDKLMKEQQAATSEETPGPTADFGPFALLAHYISDFAKTLNENEYKVASTSLTQGEIQYTDYTLTDPFKFLLSNMQVSAGTFSSSDADLKVKASSDMNRKGHFDALTVISLSNYKDFIFNMDLTALPMSSFNPYSTYFVAHPFWDGDIYFKSHNSVKKSMLHSSNTMEVRKIEVGNKVKNKTAANVPVKFAVALLRDRKGNIAIDIPIDGDLNDPNYKVGRAILKIITNILVKAVAAPYDLLASSLKCDPDNLKFIRFDYMQGRPSDAQIKNLDLVARVLDEKPGIAVELTQTYNLQAEIDVIAVTEMKKRYYLQSQNRPLSDSISYAEWDSIRLMNPADSMFVLFCNAADRDNPSLSTIQAKCRNTIGEKKLADRQMELATARNEYVYHYLSVLKKVNPEHFKMGAALEKEEQTDPSGKFIINFYAP